MAVSLEVMIEQKRVLSSQEAGVVKRLVKLSTLMSLINYDTSFL